MRGFFRVLAGSCFAFHAYAVPIGNPAAPSLLEQGFWIPDTNWLNIQCGCTVDSLSQKRLAVRSFNRSVGVRQVVLKGNSRLGDMALNIAERFHLQAELGSGCFEWRWKLLSDEAIEGGVSGGVIWNGSAKLVVFEIQDTVLAADVHAGGWDWMKGHSQRNGSPLSRTICSQARYWQAGAAFSQKIGGFFIPYIGIVANRTHLKIGRAEPRIGWLLSQRTMGLFMGCTLSRGTKIFLNVEWRGGFEEGIALSGQIRF